MTKPYRRHGAGLSRMSDGRWLVVGRDGSLTYYARAVMAAHLGRELREDELVHHRNGDCADDRIENLEIVSRAGHPLRHAKLTHEIAADIRYLRSAGWNAEAIAGAYGVTRSAVYHIASGRTWAHA